MTTIPVFSLARVLGAKPAREWLVYAHSPLQHRRDVTITVPDYGTVTVDVSVGGSIYHVKEAERSVTQVGK